MQNLKNSYYRYMTLLTVPVDCEQTNISLKPGYVNNELREIYRQLSKAELRFNLRAMSCYKTLCIGFERIENKRSITKKDFLKLKNAYDAIFYSLNLNDLTEMFNVTKNSVKIRNYDKSINYMEIYWENWCIYIGDIMTRDVLMSQSVDLYINVIDTNKELLDELMVDEYKVFYLKRKELLESDHGEFHLSLNSKVST
jgi:hypothetical protein